MTVLEIRITDTREHIVFGGDILKIARAIAHLGLRNEEFALALNRATAGMNEELTAIRLRDEMIGMINNPEKL